MEFKSKAELAKAIKKAITENDKRAIDAMLRVFQYQTESEKASGTTCIYNGVGFTGNDAEILTSFCQQYQKRGFLSAKQMVLLKKKIGKYAGQLTRLAIDNGMYIKQNGVWIVAPKKESKKRFRAVTAAEFDELVKEYKNIQQHSES
jgi:hypothetical protein